MRIAFVGKGGSGKTTLTALFTDYLSKKINSNIMLIDADMNIHISEILNFDQSVKLEHLSNPDVQIKIKEYIKANNPRIKSIGHIKKTTPPSEDSGFINLSDPQNIIFKNYSIRKDNIFLSAVGVYEKEGIGKSCYHNNLSILENILSHSIDRDEVIVSDMVAGVDAFAGSLHSQFDILLLSVEPTKRSISVYEKYRELAKTAGVINHLFVVGNKIENNDDKKFISKYIPNDKLIGFINNSNHIRKVDKGQEELDSEKIDNKSKDTLKNIYEKLKSSEIDFNTRLKKIERLHIIHSSQDYITERFGDLSNQIQNDFDFDLFIKKQYE